MTPSRFAAAGGALLVAWLGSPSIADVISDWNTAAVPPPPELKEITVEPSGTEAAPEEVLVILDPVHQAIPQAPTADSPEFLAPAFPPTLVRRPRTLSSSTPVRVV